jgi:hypothetical protein
MNIRIISNSNDINDKNEYVFIYDDIKRNSFEEEDDGDDGDDVWWW